MPLFPDPSFPASKMAVVWSYCTGFAVCVVAVELELLKVVHKGLLLLLPPPLLRWLLFPDPPIKEGVMFHQILCPQGSQNPIPTTHRPLPPQVQDLILFRRILKVHSQNLILSCWSEESKRLSQTMQFISIAFSYFHEEKAWPYCQRHHTLGTQKLTDLTWKFHP